MLTLNDLLSCDTFYLSACSYNFAPCIAIWKWQKAFGFCWSKLEDFLSQNNIIFIWYFINSSSAMKDISVFQYKLYLKECFYIRLYTYIKKSIFGFILLFFPKEKYICTFHRRWVRLMVIKMPLHVFDNGNGNRWKSWPYSFFLSSF